MAPAIYLGFCFLTVHKIFSALFDQNVKTESCSCVMNTMKALLGMQLQKPTLFMFFIARIQVSGSNIDQIFKRIKTYTHLATDFK